MGWEGSQTDTYGWDSKADTLMEDSSFRESDPVGSRRARTRQGHRAQATRCLWTKPCPSSRHSPVCEPSEGRTARLGNERRVFLETDVDKFLQRCTSLVPIVACNGSQGPPQPALPPASGWFPGPHPRVGYSRTFRTAPVTGGVAQKMPPHPTPWERTIVRGRATPESGGNVPEQRQGRMHRSPVSRNVSFARKYSVPDRAVPAPVGC